MLTDQMTKLLFRLVCAVLGAWVAKLVLELVRELAKDAARRPVVAGPNDQMWIPPQFDGERAVKTSRPVRYLFDQTTGIPTVEPMPYPDQPPVAYPEQLPTTEAEARAWWANREDAHANEIDDPIGLDQPLDWLPDMGVQGGGVGDPLDIEQQGELKDMRVEFIRPGENPFRGLAGIGDE